MCTIMQHHIRTGNREMYYVTPGQKNLFYGCA